MSYRETAAIFAKKSEFVIRKNAPSIMVYAGVGGFIATVGLAIRATTRMDEASPKLRSKIAEAKKEMRDETVLSKKEASERLARVYVGVAKETAQIYGPVLAVGTASVLLVLGGHGIMLKRQANLVALYGALDASYRVYRDRVREELGEEKELELYSRPNLRAVDQDESDDGSDTAMIDLGGYLASPYAKYFEAASSNNWNKDPEYNLMFLRAQERWANDRLKIYGYVYLNEIYEALGLDRTKAGQIVGWKREKTGKNDGFISFGLGNIYDESSRAFVNGQENIALLDFNVDGIISID